MLQSQLYEVTAGERGAIMFLQILGMTLIVIGLVGFLVSISVILYHLIRAENRDRRMGNQLRSEPHREVER